MDKLSCKLSVVEKTFEELESLLSRYDSSLKSYNEQKEEALSNNDETSAKLYQEWCDELIIKIDTTENIYNLIYNNIPKL